MVPDRPSTILIMKCDLKHDQHHGNLHLNTVCSSSLISKFACTLYASYQSILNKIAVHKHMQKTNFVASTQSCNTFFCIFPSLNIQRSFLCFYFIEIFLMHYPPYHVCKNYSTNCTGKKMFKRCQSSD